MKNPHRKLSVYILGFLIGGVVAAIGRRWEEAPRLLRVVFLLSLLIMGAAASWIVLRAIK